MKILIERKLIGLSIIIAGLLSSCEEESKSQFWDSTQAYDFDLVETIRIPIEIDSPIPHSPNFQFAIVDGVESVILNLFDNSLVFYDIERRLKYHEIILSEKEVEDFYFISKDSIIVKYTPSYQSYDTGGFFDQSQLVRIDFEGKILNQYAFENPLLRTSSNPIPDKNVISPFLRWNSLDISDENNMYFLLEDRNGFEIGTKDFVDNPFPIISKYNLNTEQLAYSTGLWYPDVNEGTYYPSSFNGVNYCISSNGFPMIRFFYSPWLHEWDFEKSTINKYFLKSSLIDSISPMGRSSTYVEGSGIDAYYLHLTYDPHKELYYSILAFNSDIYGNGNWSFVIADKEMNYIGEIFRPRMASFKPEIYEDNFITAEIVDQKFCDIKFYKLKPTGLSQADHLKSAMDTLSRLKRKFNSISGMYVDEKNISKPQLLNYIEKSSNVKINDGVLITIYSNVGCPSCRQTILEFLDRNWSVLNEQPIYIIVSGINKSEVDSELASYDIGRYKNLVIDTNGVVRALDIKVGSTNPRLTIVTNNIASIDCTYGGIDIDSIMIPAIVKKLGLEVKK